jgi:ribosomal protein L37AE/L43A
MDLKGEYMVKRICPKCFGRWYSESSTNEVWICETCKAEIPKSQECAIENELKKEGNTNGIKR